MSVTIIPDDAWSVIISYINLTGLRATTLLNSRYACLTKPMLVYLRSQCIYCIGGKHFDTGDYAKTCYAYYPLALEWRRYKDMHQTRLYHAALAYRHCLYVFGGYFSSSPDMLISDRSIHHNTERYDMSTDNWIYCQDNPINRIESVAIVYHDQILLMGGLDMNLSLKPCLEVSVFDPTSNTFIANDLAPLPKGIFNGSAIVYDDKIYLCGLTYRHQHQYLLTYDAVTDIWTEVYLYIPTRSNVSFETSWVIDGIMTSRELMLLILDRDWEKKDSWNLLLWPVRENVVTTRVKSFNLTQGIMLDDCLYYPELAKSNDSTLWTGYYQVNKVLSCKPTLGLVYRNVYHSTNVMID
jgi:hypothetical protein